MPETEISSAPPIAWFTRERLTALVLFAATALVILLSFLIVRPFLPAVAWALAFAIVAHPVYNWIERRIKGRNLAAGLAVAVVTLVLVTPMIFVMQAMVEEVGRGVDVIRQEAKRSEWREQMKRNPVLGRLTGAVESRIDVQRQIEQLGQRAGRVAERLVVGSVWGMLQLAIALFVLFYLFRDRDYCLGVLRSMVPLSRPESEQVFQRVADTIYATVYGTVAVALIQGVLGGLMFAILGLPGAVLWGAVMFVVAIVPVLGAFVVWAPVAVYLALQGQWTQAIVLTAWGMIVVGLIDNILYPILVGHRLRLHTVPVFFAIIGGLFVFGASGLVIGPVILAMTFALIQIWRCRTGSVPSGNCAP